MQTRYIKRVSFQHFVCTKKNRPPKTRRTRLASLSRERKCRSEARDDDNLQEGADKRRMLRSIRVASCSAGLSWDSRVGQKFKSGMAGQEAVMREARWYFYRAKYR